ncbi:unnamed protein product [Ambrosiozyma monospora]|uniref:Unnamed protein product n=1 Tax=Ambrosiozyma monospora TaxID=43982 RepID=A0A9W6Z3V9_AMBMO|nr:unnamed protein product [Ambrosiozyma monospora]
MPHPQQQHQQSQQTLDSGHAYDDDDDDDKEDHDQQLLISKQRDDIKNRSLSWCNKHVKEKRIMQQVFEQQSEKTNKLHGMQLSISKSIFEKVHDSNKELQEQNLTLNGGERGKMIESGQKRVDAIDIER